MKYLITESKLDNVVSMYLDNQEFIVVGNSASLFFINSEGDEEAQIRYNKYDGWCYINYNLIKEISSFFSIDNSDSKNVIGKWVEYVLEMEVTNIGNPGSVTTNTLYYSI